MNRLATALGVRPHDILASSDHRVVPLVGYIGAGAEVLSIDDHAKGGGLEEVEAPPLSGPSTVAVRVRGHMYPAYSDGDTLYYDRRDDGDLRHLIGRECVVKLADGRCFIKILQLGTQPGLWTLLSTNAPPMLDQSVEGAARVKWVLKA